MLIVSTTSTLCGPHNRLFIQCEQKRYHFFFEECCIGVGLILNSTKYCRLIGLVSYRVETDTSSPIFAVPLEGKSQVYTFAYILFLHKYARHSSIKYLSMKYWRNIYYILKVENNDSHFVENG